MSFEEILKLNILVLKSDELESKDITPTPGRARALGHQDNA
jgi:hypothetical protein